MDYDAFLKIPRECPFCLVTDPANKNSVDKSRIITENKTAYLTFSLAPYHRDHLLVIPKRHIVNILDVTDEEEKDIYELIQKSLRALNKSNYNDISVLVRDGDNTMKTVSHLHYNIIPNTRLGDIDHQDRKRVTLTNEEVQSVLERMRKLTK